MFSINSWFIIINWMQSVCFTLSMIGSTTSLVAYQTTFYNAYSGLNVVTIMAIDKGISNSCVLRQLQLLIR